MLSQTYYAQIYAGIIDLGLEVIDVLNEVLSLE